MRGAPFFSEAPHLRNAFTTENPFLETNLLEVSIGRGIRRYEVHLLFLTLLTYRLYNWWKPCFGNKFS